MDFFSSYDSKIDTYADVKIVPYDEIRSFWPRMSFLEKMKFDGLTETDETRSQGDNADGSAHKSARLEVCLR